MPQDIPAAASDDQTSAKILGSFHPPKVTYLLLAGALLALAALLYLGRLGAPPLRVNAEIRAYEIAQHMLETDVEAIPVFRGETRFNKPPLYYWSVVALSRLTQRFDLTIHRIPSAVCALGVLVLVLVWGKILGRPRESLLAAAMVAVSYLFVVQARRGTFEMMLTLFCNLSLLSFYLSATRRSALYAYFGAIFWGLAFLTKGTPSLLFSPLPIVVWLWGQGRARAIFQKQLVPILLLGGAIAASWYAYVLTFFPDARHDLLGQVLLPFGVKLEQEVTAEHREAFYFYAIEIWRCGFPMSLFLPLVVWYVWQQRGFAPESPQRLLLLTCALPLAIFSCIPMKQDHYLLPMLPALALITAQAISETCADAASKGSVLFKVPLLVLGLVGVAAGIIVGGGTYIVLDAPLLFSLAIALTVGGTATAGLVLLTRKRYVRSLVTICLVMAASFGWYFFWIRPIEDGFGSTVMLRSPNFDKQYWEQKFASYPMLRTLLDYDVGLRRLQKSQKRESAPPLGEKHVPTAGL